MKPNRAITSTNTHIDGRIHTQKQPQLQSYATSSIKSGTTSLGRQRISTGLGVSSSLSGNSIASRHTQAKTTIASQKVTGEDTQRLQSITNPPLTRTNRIISDDSPTQEYIKDKGIETLKLPRIYLRVVPYVFCLVVFISLLTLSTLPFLIVYGIFSHPLYLICFPIIF